MPRGQSDFGLYAIKDVGATVSDVGELAARLGSIVTYDKRGDVVDFDAFEEPILGWLPYISAGCSIKLTSDNFWSGCQAVHLQTDNTVGHIAYIQREYPLKGSKRLGFECSFGKFGTSNDLSWWIEYDDTVKAYDASILLNPLLRKVYRLSGGVFVEIADTGRFLAAKFAFHTLKLVADFATGEWVRLMLDFTTWDLSGLPLDPVATGVTPFLKTGFQTANRAGVGVDYVDVDNTVFTQAEP